MASTKYKASHKKRLTSELRVVVSSLRTEHGNLRKTLAETSRQHSELCMLVQRLLCLETVTLENSQHQKTVDRQAALPSEQCSERDDDLINKHYMSNTQDSTSDVEELQNQLRNALEKNKQWLEYDQQREAYVRGILDRMLWLEKQLKEANQARIQQHKEDHSDEKKRIVEMQVHYESLLLKAKGDLEELRKEIDLANQNLKTTQNWCKEKEIEVEELQLQLKSEKNRERSPREDECCSQNVDQQLKELQCALDKERRRSANFELQANLIQKCMLNLHYEDQEKIAAQERQMKISSKDLEDKKQDCSYLKKQMIRMLKALQKAQDQRDQEDQHFCEAAHPPSELSSSHSSLLNESLLECPGCQTEYPATHYRELMSHIEVCLK